MHSRIGLHPSLFPSPNPPLVPWDNFPKQEFARNLEDLESTFQGEPKIREKG